MRLLHHSAAWHTTISELSPAKPQLFVCLFFQRVPLKLDLPHHRQCAWLALSAASLHCFLDEGKEHRQHVGIAHSEHLSGFSSCALLSS